MELCWCLFIGWVRFMPLLQAPKIATGSAIWKLYRIACESAGPVDPVLQRQTQSECHEHSNCPSTAHFNLCKAHSLCKVCCLPACLRVTCFVAICRCAVATKSISLYHVAKGIGPIQCSQSIHVVMLRKRVEVPLRLMIRYEWQVSEMTGRDVHPRSSKYISRSIVDNQSWSVHRRSYFIDFPNKYTPTLPNRALEKLNPGKNGIWDTLW